MGRGSPDTGEARDAFRWNSDISAGADQNFFQSAYVLYDAQSLSFAIRRIETPQIENRIPDELPGTVESYIAAAIAFENFNATLHELFGWGNDVGGLGVATQRDHRCVLQQQKQVADLAILAEFYKPLLQAQSGGVIESAELEDGNQETFRHGFAPINTDQAPSSSVSVKIRANRWLVFTH